MQLPTDDEIVALLRAAQRQDEAAYERLYSLYADAIFRYFAHRSGDQHTAEDLTSNVFVRVVDALPRFTVPPQAQALAFTGWLFRIAAHQWADYHRKHREHLPLDPQWASNEQPNDPVDRRLEYADVRSALRYLTDEQQQVLLLRFNEELSLEQVAALTGQTVGGVKAMQHRALQRLRQLLQQAWERTRR